MLSGTTSIHLKRAIEHLHAALDSLGKNFTGEAKHELYQLEAMLKIEATDAYPDRSRWLRLVSDARDALVVGGSMGIPRALPILRGLEHEARLAMQPKPVKAGGLTLVYDRDRDTSK
jgi:hypothetical protein